MTTKVNVNGTEVEVALPDETVAEIQNNARLSGYNEGYNKGREDTNECVARNIFDMFLEKVDYERPGEILLTDDEEDEVFEAVLNEFGHDYEDHVYAIIQGTYKTCIELAVQEIADNRKGLFAVPVEVTTTVTVYVKAKTMDAAVNYVEDMSDWEMNDLASEEDFEYKVDRYGVDEVDENQLPYCYEPYEADD